MTMTIRQDQDEALIAAARSMFANQRARSERVCYYRLPQRTPSGAPHKQAGWISWGDTQEGVKLGKLVRGQIPLEQFGFIRTKRSEEDPDGPFELHGHWGPILCHRDGPREFPVSQIMAYHWYDAERLRIALHGGIPSTLRVRDGMVLWPQLSGQDIRIFACPECGDWRAIEAVFLARHLRIHHDYDRADIIAFGSQYGVDFATEINREGRVIRSFSFDMPTDEPEEVELEEAGFSIDVARPERRGPGRPRKEI